MTITVRHYAGKKLTNMTNIELETLAMLKQAAKTYIAQSEREEERANRSEQRDSERQSMEDELRELVRKQVAASTRTVPEDVIWVNRRYDIAKTCLGMLAIGTVPDIMEKREITPTVAVRTAIELADELIKQLRYCCSEIPNNQADTRGYDKEGGER